MHGKGCDYFENSRGAAAGDGRVCASGYNDTAKGADPVAAGGWVSPGRFGLDQGMIMLMLENFRAGLVWRLMRGSAPIRSGLQRAGFRGGWLGDPVPP